MPNYNKSFNFRNGVQVDEDDLIVRGSLVGIGTTIPRSELDVVGNVSVTGLVTSANLYVSGIATFTDVKIGTGITIYGNAGIISATFYGDGSNLQGLPTSKWNSYQSGIATSIYADAPFVGIGTTNPTASLQIGGRTEIGSSGVGISSDGHINASGIITASSFVGGGSGLTALNASQITSGTIPEDRLPEDLNVTGIITAATLQAAQIDNTGIATISDLKLGQTNISGVATVGFATVSAAYVNNLTVGVATVTTLNATSSIAANTITGLQNVVITGIATVGLVSASNAYVTGVTTTGTISATTGTITNLTVSNAATLGNVTETNVNVTGIVTSASIRSTQINNTGIATLSAASITGLTAGVTTSTKIRSGAVRIGYGLTNEIDTFDTDLLLDSAGGTVIVDDNLNVTGITTVTTLRVNTSVLPDEDLGADLGSTTEYFGAAYVGEINVGVAASNEITTRSNTLVLDSDAGTVQVDDNLVVTGYTYLTGITTVQDSILPDSDQDAALGSSSLRFSDAYIDNVRIGVGSDNEVSTGSGNLKLNSSSTLVEVADRFKVTGESYLAGISTVESGLLPDDDKGAYLGSSSKAFSEAYIDEVRIGVGGTNVVDTREGNLVLNSSSTLVEVANRFKVTGESYLTGITTVQNGLLPDDDKGAYLGSSSKAFSEAYIDEVRIGVGGTNVVDTREGNLVLNSSSTLVEVADRFKVTGESYLAGISTVESGLLPDDDKGAYLGSSSKSFSEAYIDNVRIGVGSDNEVSTGSGNLKLDSSSKLVEVADRFKVTGESYLTGITTVQNGLLPDTDKDAYLGSSSKAFSEAYIDEVRIGVGGTNVVDTREGNLVLNSSSTLVEVANRFKVTGETYLAGISTVETGLLPDTDKDAYLGSSSKAFSEAYIDEVRIGVGGTNVVDTREGNLVLNSSSTLVEVANRFKVTGESYLTGITTVQNGLVPDSDLGSTLGASDNAFDGAYVDGIRIGVAASTTIDTRGGKLILDSDENLVEVNNDLTVNQVSNLLENVYVGPDGNDLFVDVTQNRIGIGTSAPSNDIEVTRNGNLTVELVSETGTSTLALAQTLGLGNDSGSVSYANGDLSISNKSDTGAINLELAAGTGINTNAFFKVNHKGTTIVSIGDSGVTGINKEEPVHALDVEGNIAVNGYGRVVGVLTIGTGGNEVTFGNPDTTISANLSGNVNATSGFSTFRNLDVQDTVSIGATLSVTGVGIGSFENGIVVGTSNQVTVDNIALSPLLNVSSGDVHVSGSAIFSNTTSKVGIATTGFLSDDRPSLAAEDSNFPGVNYGVLQVRGDMSVTGYSGGASIFVGGPVGNTTAFLTYKDSRTLDDQNYQYSVGINTHAPRSCLDLGASASPLLLPAMDTARKQYMIDNPPQSRISVYNSTNPDVNLPGSLLFNTSTGRAELGIGNTGIMCGIATLTYNGSDFAAFLPPKMTTADRDSMTTSGIPDGAIVYNISTNKLQLRASSAWVDLN